MSNVGRLIHLTRQVCGTSIHDLAARIGRSEGHLQNIENGMLSGTPSTLLAVAACLDIAPSVMRDAYLQDAVEAAQAVWRNDAVCKGICKEKTGKTGIKTDKLPYRYLNTMTVFETYMISVVIEYM